MGSKPNLYLRKGITILSITKAIKILLRLLSKSLKIQPFLDLCSEEELEALDLLERQTK